MPEYLDPNEVTWEGNKKDTQQPQYLNPNEVTWEGNKPNTQPDKPSKYLDPNEVTWAGSRPPTSPEVYEQRKQTWLAPTSTTPQPPTQELQTMTPEQQSLPRINEPETEWLGSIGTGLKNIPGSAAETIGGTTELLTGDKYGKGLAEWGKQHYEAPNVQPGSLKESVSGVISDAPTFVPAMGVGAAAGAIASVGLTGPAAVAAAAPAAMVGAAATMGLLSAGRKYAETGSYSQAAISGGFGTLMGLIPGSKVTGGIVKRLGIKTGEMAGIGSVSSGLEVIANSLSKGETPSFHDVWQAIKSGGQSGGIMGLTMSGAHEGINLTKGKAGAGMGVKTKEPSPVITDNPILHDDVQAVVKTYADAGHDLTNEDNAKEIAKAMGKKDVTPADIQAAAMNHKDVETLRSNPETKGIDPELPDYDYMKEIYKAQGNSEEDATKFTNDFFLRQQWPTEDPEVAESLDWLHRLNLKRGMTPEESRVRVLENFNEALKENDANKPIDITKPIEPTTEPEPVKPEVKAEEPVKTEEQPKPEETITTATKPEVTIETKPEEKPITTEKVDLVTGEKEPVKEVVPEEVKPEVPPEAAQVNPEELSKQPAGAGMEAKPEVTAETKPIEPESKPTEPMIETKPEIPPVENAQEANKPSEGTQGPIPPTTEPLTQTTTETPEEKTTSVKNAVTTKERVARGLEEVKKYVKQVDPAFQEGVRLVESGERDPRAMAKSLKDNPRPISDVETGILAYDRAKLYNEHSEAMNKLEDAIASGEKGLEEEARQQLARVEDEISNNDFADVYTGTETSAAFRMRQQLVKEDYSLARVMQRVRVARGSADIPDNIRTENAKLVKLLQESLAREAEYKKEKEERESKQAAQRTNADFIDAVVKSGKAKARPRAELKAELKDLAKQFAKTMSTLNMNFNPEQVKILTTMWWKQIKVGIHDVNDIVSTIHQELSDVRDYPDLSDRDIRDAVSKYGQVTEMSQDEINVEMRKSKRIAKRITDLERIRLEKEAPLRSGLQRDIMSAEERRYEKEINQAMREAGIDDVSTRTPEEQWKTSLDSVKSRLRHQIEDLNEQLETGKKTPKKLGIKYDEEANLLKAERDRLKDALEVIEGKPGLSDEQRIKIALNAIEKSTAEYQHRLKTHNVGPFNKPSLTPDTTELQNARAKRDAYKKQYDDMVKAAKPAVDPEAAAKKRTADRIVEVTKMIKEHKLTRDKTPSQPESPELRALKAELGKLNEQLAQMRKAAKPVVDPNIQKVKNAMDALDRSIADIKRRIEGNILTTEKRISSTPDTVELQAKRVEKQKLVDQLNQMRKDAKPETDPNVQRVKNAIRALEKSSAEIERRISTGDINPSKKVSKTIETPELKFYRDRHAKLSEQLEQMRKDARPEPDPEAAALKAFKTRQENRIRDMKEMLATGNYEKSARRVLKLDAEGQNLKNETGKLKDQIDNNIMKQKLANRTMIQKIRDFFVKWRRGVLLSGTTTVGKLTTAATMRQVTTPAEEIAGNGLSKIPGISQIADMAPREGAGLSVLAESAAFRQWLEKQTWQDIKDVVATGKGSLDRLYGRHSGNDLPPEALDFIGHLHGALKVLPKRAEFYRSLQKRTEWYMRKGYDMTDPSTAATIMAEAYNDANRAIFMQDNAAVDAYKMMGSFLEKKGFNNVNAAMKVLLPIVKIPTNFIAESTSYAAGGAKALYKVITAKGIANLKPNEADYIMRALKKQSVGAAMMLVGYYASDSIGGYFQPGEKRKEGDVKAGGLRIFGVDVPRWALHTPVLEILQVGATLHRLHDYYTNQNKKIEEKNLDREPDEQKPLVTDITGRTITRAGLGLLEKVPFYEEPVRIIDSLRSFSEIKKAGYGIIESFLVPPDLRRWAKSKDVAGDKQIPRKYEGLWDTILASIPGERNKLPLDVEKIKRMPADSIAYLITNAPPGTFQGVEEEKIYDILDKKVDKEWDNLDENQRDLILNVPPVGQNRAKTGAGMGVKP